MYVNSCFKLEQFRKNQGHYHACAETSHLFSIQRHCEGVQRLTQSYECVLRLEFVLYLIYKIASAPRIAFRMASQ